MYLPPDPDTPALSAFYPLSELPDHLPRRNGKKANVCLGYRWAKRGKRGVRLRTIRLFALCTCDEWVMEFAEATGVQLPGSAAPPPQEMTARPRWTAAQARRAHERAVREMEEAGLM